MGRNHESRLSAHGYLMPHGYLPRTLQHNHTQITTYQLSKLPVTLLQYGH